VVLTGGSSARKLYDAWSSIVPSRSLSNVNFFLGDERCVPSDDEACNLHLIKTTLFNAGMPQGCTLTPMAVDSLPPELAASSYSKLLPEAIDVLLLSVGEDGHIASIFPGSAAVNESYRRVIPVISNKKPSRRLTITPRVIRSSRSIFILANGKAKSEIVHRAMTEPIDVMKMPVQLIENGTFLIDTRRSLGLDY
jgi:6-phosphogluconolactonase